MSQFSAVRRNGSAMQFSAVAALVSVALISLPSLAADALSGDAYGNHIVSRFEKTGAQSGTFDNLSVATSAFDFAQYFSHTCYNPTAYDIPNCEREFGPYANLKETLTSGKLTSIFAKYKYLAGAEKLVLPKPVAQTVPATSSSSSAPASNTPGSQPFATPTDAVTLQKQRDARSKLLWTICQKRTNNDRAEAGLCYRRNVRLLNQESSGLDMETNVY